MDSRGQNNSTRWGADDSTERGRARRVGAEARGGAGPEEERWSRGARRLEDRGALVLRVRDGRGRALEPRAVRAQPPDLAVGRGGGYAPPCIAIAFVIIKNYLQEMDRGA